MAKKEGFSGKSKSHKVEQGDDSFNLTRFLTGVEGYHSELEKELAGIKIVPEEHVPHRWAETTNLLDSIRKLSEKYEKADTTKKRDKLAMTIQELGATLNRKANEVREAAMEYRKNHPLEEMPPVVPAPEASNDVEKLVAEEKRKAHEGVAEITRNIAEKNTAAVKAATESRESQELAVKGLVKDAKQLSRVMASGLGLLTGESGKETIENKYIVFAQALDAAIALVNGEGGVATLREVMNKAKAFLDTNYPGAEERYKRRAAEIPMEKTVPMAPEPPADPRWTKDLKIKKTTDAFEARIGYNKARSEGEKLKEAVRLAKVEKNEQQQNKIIKMILAPEGADIKDILAEKNVVVTPEERMRAGELLRGDPNLIDKISNYVGSLEKKLEYGAQAELIIREAEESAAEEEKARAEFEAKGQKRAVSESEGARLGEKFSDEEARAYEEAKHEEDLREQKPPAPPLTPMPPMFYGKHERRPDYIDEQLAGVAARQAGEAKRLEAEEQALIDKNIAAEHAGEPIDARIAVERAAEAPPLPNPWGVYGEQRAAMSKEFQELYPNSQDIPPDVLDKYLDLRDRQLESFKPGAEAEREAIAREIESFMASERKAADSREGLRILPGMFGGRVPVEASGFTVEDLSDEERELHLKLPESKRESHLAHVAARRAEEAAAREARERKSAHVDAEMGGGEITAPQYAPRDMQEEMNKLQSEPLPAVFRSNRSRPAAGVAGTAAEEVAGAEPRTAKGEPSLADYFARLRAAARGKKAAGGEKEAPPVQEESAAEHIRGSVRTREMVREPAPAGYSEQGESTLETSAEFRKNLQKAVERAAALEKEKEAKMAERIETSHAHLAERREKLGKEAKKMGWIEGTFRWMGEKYNKLSFIEKLGVGVSLGVGAVALAGVSWLGALGFATGLAVQRAFGMASMFLKFEKGSQEGRWAKEKAMGKALLYTVGMGYAIREAVDLASQTEAAHAVQEWLKQHYPFGPAKPPEMMRGAAPIHHEATVPLEGHQAAEADVRYSDMRIEEAAARTHQAAQADVRYADMRGAALGTGEAAAVAATIPDVSAIDVAASEYGSHGYEGMLKELAKQLPETKPANIPDGSDLAKLYEAKASADPSELGKAIHRIATDSKHEFFTGKGSAFIDTNARMTIDSASGNVLFNGEVHAPAGVRMVPEVQAAPAPEELSSSVSAKQALEEQRQEILARLNSQAPVAPADIELQQPTEPPTVDLTQAQEANPNVSEAAELGPNAYLNAHDVPIDPDVTHGYVIEDRLYLLGGSGDLDAQAQEYALKNKMSVFVDKSYKNWLGWTTHRVVEYAPAENGAITMVIHNGSSLVPDPKNITGRVF